MERNRLQKAGEQAEEFLQALDIDELPVDPFQVAASERRLKLITGDFRKRFDGQLEYHPEKRRFLVFLNTKYDRLAADGKHHPRTRFSLAHELGHLYLEHHSAYLMSGGKPHGSKSEFGRAAIIEREADAFAAALLMPSGPFRSQLNESEPTLDAAGELGDTFETSQISTIFRAVQLSDFPCLPSASGRVGSRGAFFPIPCSRPGAIRPPADPFRRRGRRRHGRLSCRETLTGAARAPTSAGGSEPSIRITCLTSTSLRNTCRFR